MQVDKECRMASLIALLKNHKKLNQAELEHKKSVLIKQKKLRIFSYLKNYKNQQIDLNSKFNILKEKTEKKLKCKFMVEWVQQYDTEC